MIIRIFDESFDVKIDVMYVQGALQRLVDLVQTDAAELDHFLVGLPQNWDCSTMPQWTLAPAMHQNPNNFKTLGMHTYIDVNMCVSSSFKLELMMLYNMD